MIFSVFKTEFLLVAAYENHFNSFKNFLQNVSAGKGEGYKEKKRKRNLSSCKKNEISCLTKVAKKRFEVAKCQMKLRKIKGIN